MAGAAGTTALNTVTYRDMAVRGRPISDSPERVVKTVVEGAGAEIPGSGDTQDNRLQGLGPLSGIGVGVGVGVVASLLRSVLLERGVHVPAPVAVLLISVAAMASSDVPLKVFGISDPSSWSAPDWLSDAVPHLAYGLVTYAAIRAGESGGIRPGAGTPVGVTPVRSEAADSAESDS